MPRPPLDRWLVSRMGLPPDAPTPDRDTLREWQFRQLRRTIAHARCASPFYARRLARVDPDAVRTPQALAMLPRTSADDLRTRPEDFLCVSQDDVARVVTLSSSGSSGAPKRFFFTSGDLERTIEFFRHGMESIVPPDETVLALLPGNRPGGVGKLFAEAVARRGATAVFADDASNIPDVLDLLWTSRASCIIGSPVHVQAVAKLWRHLGLERGIIRSALMCWDTLSGAAATTIARAFGCDIFTHWGMTETCLGGAVDCAAGSGMHLREPDFLMEITDQDTGLPVPDGVYGEIVITTLSRRAMPLIRYRTGDMGRLVPGTCACGSPLRRLADVPGRIGHATILPDNTPLHQAELDELLLRIPDVLDLQASLNPARPVLTLEIDTLPGADPSRTVRNAAALIPKIVHARQTCGLTIETCVRHSDGRIGSGFEKRAITSSTPEVATT
ncbi:phenylacetate-coenzyme A ligase PaaK-like adenylate-forming protein [Desulfobaculum xiamenense]|uniref:Phenylacetate-coenzyme A ligase PaaK-like adenylate-forming protein n=1 Tax=Desulfobaculum xiamenense TaxID=995050 RepID=A0A846QDT2_9BACT|nr:AMP-binding protein [Desulfobaculum xiamenense]NJB66461.1 phenylacetate-coenzyme A ligase PaaK-like adenylate-forming protein [Desulfobaculum xiamenense]